MNIMVFDVPAEGGGALSILSEFYNEVKSKRDKSIKWIFVLSTPSFQETEYIKVLRFPWVKKSWGHRFFFDNVIAPQLIKKYNVDEVFSLQNVIVPRTDVKQTLYLHQPLPFIEHKFSFSENKLFWIYQNIISKNIFSSIKKADKVIVQTEWMRKACIQKTNIDSEKVVIMPPQIKIDDISLFQKSKESLSTFFYPASELKYKNHEIVVEACKRLKDEGFNDYRIIFTLKGNENDHITKLYREALENDLPINFVGKLQREVVFNYYANSVLLFPSYIETFGLPLLEAKLYKSVIIASNSEFSHEILDNYENVYFFDPFNSLQLSNLMKMTTKLI